MPNSLTVKLVNTLLAAIPECRAIYRFGSWGTEMARAESDIDLAVLPRQPLDAVLCWELGQSLAVLAGRDVDLVDLLRASTVLRMQVISSGKRLHCADLVTVEAFEDRVFSSYARLNEERREILADVRRRGSVYGE